MGLTDTKKPDFQLLANGVDITATIRERLISIALTDATGIDSDTLEIQLASPPARPVRRPPRGAELQLSLGYDGSLTKMGLFVVDEVELSGWPEAISIRARGAPFDKSAAGAAHLQTQKTRTWKRETTIQAMVSKIAKEHGLQAQVSPSLASTKLPQFDQTAESDISFLVRVANRYDAMVKPGGGKLSFLKRGEQKTASGAPMARITVDAKQASSWRYVEASRDDGGTVVAFWHSKRSARRQQVTVGSGDPVKQLRQYYSTEDAAKAAAQAELDKRLRARGTFSVSVPGDPKLSAECTLVPTGFHPDVPSEWLVTRVSHRLGSEGYRCELEAELPNED